MVVVAGLVFKFVLLCVVVVDSEDLPLNLLLACLGCFGKV